MRKGVKKTNVDFKQVLVAFIILAGVFLAGYFNPDIAKDIYGADDDSEDKVVYSYNIGDIPEYSNEPYVVINNNVPNFDEGDYNKDFENYSPLDSLGRCGVAYANICKKTMPADGEKRGDISSVRPSGWKQKKYNGEYLYNRCHLIGYQLSNENDNKLNLITGTRYFNVEGMLPFENEVADYVKAGENRHVLYRVTPIYDGENLVAKGVQMEAFSVNDNGEGVCYNVFVYNVQPGVSIDYSTGDSSVK
ncbi:MAG: DNA/RNA non-specific endonuclease [Clostridia bacterium]|nr:DNA/RNA non-specific endonuclease [Clostridia bacterium]